MEFWKKNPLLSQRSNFDLIVTQDYNFASLYLKIALRIFFRLCNLIVHSKHIKFTQVKFPKKVEIFQKNPLFGQSLSTFWKRQHPMFLQCWLNSHYQYFYGTCKLISTCANTWLHKIFNDSKSNFINQPFGAELFCIKSILKFLAKVLEINLWQSLFLV